MYGMLHPNHTQNGNNSEKVAADDVDTYVNFNLTLRLSSQYESNVEKARKNAKKESCLSFRRL